MKDFVSVRYSPQGDQVALYSKETEKLHMVDLKRKNLIFVGSRNMPNLNDYCYDLRNRYKYNAEEKQKHDLLVARSGTPGRLCWHLGERGWYDPVEIPGAHASGVLSIAADRSGR